MKRANSVHWQNYRGVERVACGKRQPLGGTKIRTTLDKHKATCNTCRRLAGLKPVTHEAGPPSSYAQLVEMRLQYAGAIGLLCTLSTQLSRNGERDDNLDSIEAAVADFCRLTGWTHRRVLHRIEVFPPPLKGANDDGKQEETQGG